MIKQIILLLILIIAFPCLVFGAIDTDLRVKFGNAAGAQRIELESGTGHGGGDIGTNAQAEVVLSPRWDSPAGFLIGVGVFHRQHKGSIDDLSMPTRIDYSVTGISFAPGLRVKLNDSWNVELKGEVGLSRSGRLRLNSPGYSWNYSTRGTYVSLSGILGFYYQIKSLSSQIGFEVGGQHFYGQFDMVSNSSARGWYSGQVTGESAIVNVVYGIKF